MRKVSKKQTLKNREVAKIKSNLPSFCRICGRQGHDAAHLLPKSVFPEHYTNPLNIVVLCRTCHRRFDDDKSFRKMQVELFKQACSIDERGAIRYFGMD